MIILGSGVSGLSFAYFLLKGGYKKEIVIVEKSNRVGGLAKTYGNDGNYFDIGPHVFKFRNSYAKEIWERFSDFNEVDRITRIYYKGKLLHYPLEFNNILNNFSALEIVRIIVSYLQAQIFVKDISTFEGWVSKNFGYELYKIFFKGYTEKIVGLDAKKISKDWIEKRSNKLSIFNIIKSILGINSNSRTLYKKIRYPICFSGNLYNRLAEYLKERGVKIYLNEFPIEIKKEDNVFYVKTNKRTLKSRFLASSIPIDELFSFFGEKLNVNYRNHITINLLVDKKIKLKDQWIYNHDPENLISRIYFPQNFNKDMCKKGNCLTLEIFCGYDEIWNMDGKILIKKIKSDLEKMEFLKGLKIVSYKIIRSEKAYPLYTNDLKETRYSIKGFSSKHQIILLGRSGSFKYIDMDEAIKISMERAKEVLELEKRKDK